MEYINQILYNNKGKLSKKKKVKLFMVYVKINCIELELFLYA